MQDREQPILFFRCVVMHKADAEDTAVRLHTKSLGQIQRIEIPIPGEDSAFSEERCNFCWIVIAEPERKCRTSLIETMLIGNSENSYSRNFL